MHFIVYRHGEQLAIRPIELNEFLKEKKRGDWAGRKILAALPEFDDDSYWDKLADGIVIIKGEVLNANSIRSNLVG